MKLTVIIADDTLLTQLNEPIQYRSVQVELTLEQQQQLLFRNEQEFITQAFIEPQQTMQRR